MRAVIIFLFSVFACCSSFAQSGWVLQKSGTTADLLGVSTYDGRNAVAVGMDGTVITTDYAGIPWLVEQKPTQKNLLGVTSISAKILCAVGPKDSIYRSTDRGATWSRIRSAVRGECYSNESGNQLTTAFLAAITYDSISKLCVAVGEQQEAVFSSDSGKHWVEKLTFPYKYPSWLTHLRCVSVSKDAILASGTVEPITWSTRFYISTNQGEDWVKRSTNYTGAYWKVYEPTFLGCNVRAWILVGTRGFIYHSKSKGIYWDTIQSGVKTNLNAVCFADEINGFIVGDNGVILMTRDGGYNWVRQYSPTNENLRSVSMFDPFHGFICGDKGTILYTQDGGFYVDAVFASPQSGFSIRVYPNPASSQTSIEITLPHRSQIRVRIYNSLGVEIAVIAGGTYDAGKQSFGWNGSNMASGVYVCSLEADGMTFNTQINIVK